MNILDENIIKSQRQRLRSWRIPVRQIGHDIARKGLQGKRLLALKCRSFATTTRRPIGRGVVRLSQARLQAP